MAKREIRMNYEQLGDIAERIKAYRDALFHVIVAMERTNRIIEASNNSAAIEELGMAYHSAHKWANDRYMELDDLYRLLRDYIRDMTAIIEPTGKMTRVGRNDVYHNLRSIRNALEDMGNIKNHVLLYEAYTAGKTPEELAAMERNYEKIVSVLWEKAFPRLQYVTESCSQKLLSYYENEITDYENTDDLYRKRAKEIRVRYSSTAERIRQGGIDVSTTVGKIIKGAAFALKDVVIDFFALFGSIGNMIYYAVTGEAALVAIYLAEEPPKWAESALKDSVEYHNEKISMLIHPETVVEAMAQQVNDTYEEEGLEFCISYVVTDFVIGKEFGKLLKKNPEIKNPFGKKGAPEGIGSGYGKSIKSGSKADTKPYTNSRPSFRKGVVEEVWENAKGPDGLVRDPNTGEVINWTPGESRKGVWDMGHIPEAKYSEMHEAYMNGELTTKEFVDWYNDPANYRPELPSNNRSHKYE